MNLYETVTARIIRELEAGVPPWVKPWKAHKAGTNILPANFVTGRWYSGINVLILWHEAQERGYPTMGYCTYQQAREAGAHVRKGEKASIVVFVKPVQREEDDGSRKQSTILKSYPVFNLAQLEDVPEKFRAVEPPQERAITYANALQLLERSGVPVTHGGDKACYYPSLDKIAMPPLTAFQSEEDYWGTANHELVHATGHKVRLDRQMGKRFGDNAYAAEELVAELGSAFLCARLGIPATFRSASYLDHWLKVLKADSRAIFTASSHAGKASDWLWDAAFSQAAEAA